MSLRASSVSDVRRVITGVSSARTVVAGLLLIFPGVVSDLIAITLLLLPGRRAAVLERATIRDLGGSVIDGEYRRTR